MTHSVSRAEMGTLYESLELERLEIKKANSWRSKLLTYPVVGLVALSILVTFKTYKSYGADLVCKLPGFNDDKVDALIVDTEEQVQVDTSFTGSHFLFDFATEDGALERVSVHEKEEYQDILRSISPHADYWMTQVGTSELADETDKLAAWDTAGAVVPWLPNEAGYKPRTVPKLFNNPTAPHIVFFLVDDWGYNDIGYHSTYMSWTTPNIDRLASKGVKLGNYYTSEFCVPSRAALMTGRYALRYGMHNYMDDTDRERLELPTGEVTLAEELKSAGYHTNLVGKWHLGFSRPSKTPQSRGFDYFFGYLGGLVDYWNKDFLGYLDFRENERVIREESLLTNDTHTAFIYQQRAEEVIANHAINHPDEPMFLYYASQLIHSDWAVPHSYLERCSNVVDNSTLSHPSLYYVYCGMNLLLDEVIGNLTCALEKNNMAENTVFVLASDNGGISRMEGNNFPYRGAKGTLFRGAQSVPAFITAPTRILPASAQGTTYEGQIHVSGKKNINVCFGYTN